MISKSALFWLIYGVVWIIILLHLFDNFLINSFVLGKVLNHYFDTVQEIGHNQKTKCVFLNGDRNSVRDGLLQAEASSNGQIN